MLEDNVKGEQFSLTTILIMFAWPAAWFSILIYGLGPLLLKADGTFPTWAFLMVSMLGNGAELLAALIILRREGYKLTLSSLKERINWRLPDKGWKWAAAFGVFIVAVGVGTWTSQFSSSLAAVPGFIPPDWFPPSINPLVEINSAQDAFPDIAFEGNIGFLIVMFVFRGFLFNVIGEELYYRGVLLPRMKGVFGKWAWLANGVLFVLKHIYFRWNFPGIWTAGPALAYVAGPLGSLPLAVLFHWIANDLFLIIGSIPAVFGP